ncbi:MAG: EAL domain-containing protein [Burkholderiaceae bacterium]|nr:EAL domain-containing protein [Burkholderiaceae bacterium]
MNPLSRPLTVWLGRRALQARLTALMLVILLAGIWIPAWYASSKLRDDYQRLLGEQQYSLASLVAAEVDRELSNSVAILERVALGITPAMISEPERLQMWLGTLPVFQSVFEGGTFMTDSQGRVLAGVPVALGRRGMDYSDRDYIADVVSAGKPVIGHPRIGGRFRYPALGIGVPVRDASGNVLGVLAGIINLETAAFLRTIEDSRYVRAGNYLLVSRQSRQIVAATEKFRIMESLPEPGVSPVLDSLINGFEGVTQFVNPIGVDVLTAVRQIPTAGWYAAVATPTSQVYAPIRQLQQQILLATILLTVVMCVLLWWTFSRLLRPLEQVADSLSDIAVGTKPLSPLAGGGSDELGRVVRGFNRLLVELGRRQESLAESSELYQTVFRTSPDALTLTRLEDGRYLEVNDGFTRLFGWAREEVVGKTSSELDIWYNWTDRSALIQKIREFGECENHEAQFRTRGGNVVSTTLSAKIISIRGERCMIAVTHDLSARKEALDQIQHIAYTDILTGLPNRRMFMDRLTQAQAACQQTGSLGALIYVDLDEFRMINDALGHEQGDQLLKIIADRLRASMRQGEIASRLGGDEFVVLMENLGNRPDAAGEEAMRHAGEILEVLRTQVSLSGSVHERTSSLGVSLFGQVPESPAEPLRRVEMAMYRAKAEGRNKVCLFEPAMQVQISARMDLDSQLREALRLSRFLLYYQTQVDAHGNVFGVEALVRWNDPVRGLVPPGEFIKFMEESSLIVTLGDWVMETACEQLARWASQPEFAHLSIAVNVSAMQFHQPGFVDKVIAALERTGARPQALKLELTESLLVTQMEWVVGKMSTLKARGVRFSLDDFGTGFSSLYYLKRLPLDQLKIDQGFVANILIDPNDRAIASMVVALGSSLGLQVIAEGVETEAQRDALRNLGCGFYQGYLFGRPMAVDALEASIRGCATPAGPGVST